LSPFLSRGPLVFFWTLMSFFFPSFYCGRPTWFRWPLNQKVSMSQANRPLPLFLSTTLFPLFSAHAVSCFARLVLHVPPICWYLGFKMFFFQIPPLPPTYWFMSPFWKKFSPLGSTSGSVLAHRLPFPIRFSECVPCPGPPCSPFLAHFRACPPQVR